MYQRKTRDEYQLMSKYPDTPWECECAADNRKEARQLLKDYRENGGGQYYIKWVRVPLAIAA